MFRLETHIKILAEVVAKSTHKKFSQSRVFNALKKKT